jgi:hypothetical protein
MDAAEDVGEQVVVENIWTKEEVIGGWRGLRNEALHNLYYSPDIIRMSKSRTMRRAEHVARTGRREMRIGFW